MSALLGSSVDPRHLKAAEAAHENLCEALIELDALTDPESITGEDAATLAACLVDALRARERLERLICQWLRRSPAEGTKETTA